MDTTVNLFQARKSRWLGVLPWLLFIFGLVPFAYSTLTYIWEFGDPTYTANDGWQHAATITWPLLFLSAVLTAVVARRFIALGFLTLLVGFFSLVGWLILR